VKLFSQPHRALACEQVSSDTFGTKKFRARTL